MQDRHHFLVPPQIDILMQLVCEAFVRRERERVRGPHSFRTSSVPRDHAAALPPQGLLNISQGQGGVSSVQQATENGERTEE